MQVFIKPALALICALVTLSSLTPVAAPPPSTPPAAIEAVSLNAAARPRGYLTSPSELVSIARKAAKGTQPYADAVDDVLDWAQKPWEYPLDSEARCPDAEQPAWNDNDEGTPKLYARALAYHLTGQVRYAREASAILEQIMSEVSSISIKQQQCRLNFSWGTPELVASADLIETYWQGKTCRGPVSTVYGQNDLTQGSCKKLFQNWLVKNPYYVVSYSAERAQSNWGAAATNTSAYIADYVGDRPEIKLIARTKNAEIQLSPHQAYVRARQLALDRMNGYRVELDSRYSCDYLHGAQQKKGDEPVKSQITELGIIPEDARRDEFCNIEEYDGSYQNYPQLHLGNNIQQCELLLRRGDSSCYDNVSRQDVKNFSFIDAKGKRQTTELHKGRGSIERAIQAIILDSETEWKKDSSLEVAYHYYLVHHTLPGIELWFAQLQRPSKCSQDICFGTLTHGFAQGETPAAPLVVRAP